MLLLANEDGLNEMTLPSRVKAAEGGNLGNPPGKSNSADGELEVEVTGDVGLIGIGAEAEFEGAPGFGSLKLVKTA